MTREREHRRAARARGLTLEEWREAVADESAAEDRCVDCSRLLGRCWMVHDALWSVFGVGRLVLCLSCFERRLGRRIAAHDLTVCGANLAYPRLRRLIERELERWPAER